MTMTSSADVAPPVRRSVEPEEIMLDMALPQDARERKRVLNVLAQRRYRRRKKQKQAVLEDMLTKVVSTIDTHPNQAPVTPSPGLTNTSTSDFASINLPEPCELLPFEDRSQTISGPNPSSLGEGVLQDASDSWFLELVDSDQDAFASWPSTDTSSLSTLLQADEVQNTTFSDDYNLAVPELDLLRASFEIASRLHSADRLWDLQAASIFQDAHNTQLISELPENLQPTETQLSTAHHPIVDILPWPSVRDKLIRMYSMPPTFWPRHPDDHSECSIVRLVYDMEAGGIRVWGAHPASEESWEIGESLFTAWWWALDGKILSSTNRRRAARGQRPLQELSLRKFAPKAS